MPAQKNQQLSELTDFMALSTLYNGHGPMDVNNIRDSLRNNSDGYFDLSRGTVYSSLQYLTTHSYLNMRWVRDKYTDSDVTPHRHRRRAYTLRQVAKETIEDMQKEPQGLVAMLDAELEHLGHGPEAHELRRNRWDYWKRVK